MYYMVKIMENDLYINIWDYVNDRYPFQIFIGGRGTGKTYSALRGLVIDGKVEKNRKFIIMRRTAEELDFMCDSKTGEGANNFKPINDDYNTNYGYTSIVKNLLGIYHRTVGDEGGYNYVGNPLGYGVALSTISKIRGLSFEDCDYLIYDEFIKEKHVRKMKGECDALFNAIETINRNRELKGAKPIKVILLANSNDIYNEICVGLGVVTEMEKMVRTGKEHRYFDDRGLAIHIMKDNPRFVEQKQKTALYRLTEGTTFNEMALHNSFAYNDFSDVKHLDLKGYEPVVGLGKAWIYKKKGEQRFYVTYAEARVPHYTYGNELDKYAFNRIIGVKLFDLSMVHAITYESYELKEMVLDTIGLTS